MRHTARSSSPSSATAQWLVRPCPSPWRLAVDSANCKGTNHKTDMRNIRPKSAKSSRKVKRCEYPGCTIFFYPKRSTGKYCGGAHAKAAQRKAKTANVLRDAICRDCGCSWNLVVRQKSPICCDCLQFEKDCRRHDRRFPFKLLREPFFSAAENAAKHVARLHRQSFSAATEAARARG